MSKYKNQNIIGHFGLGFYSAFMVADKVEIKYPKSPQGGSAVVGMEAAAERPNSP